MFNYLCIFKKCIYKNYRIHAANLHINFNIGLPLSIKF